MDGGPGVGEPSYLGRINYEQAPQTLRRDWLAFCRNSNATSGSVRKGGDDDGAGCWASRHYELDCQHTGAD